MVKGSVFLRLYYAIAPLTNTDICLFFCVVDGYFVSQTRADALQHGFPNITILEKLRKYSELFVNGAMAFYTQKTEHFQYKE